jgi:hypothetical protein
MVNINAIMLLLLLTLLHNVINAVRVNMKSNFVNTVVSSVLAFGLTFSPISDTFAANDALDSAMRAMTTTKEKSIEDRAFDELPKASKKRRAIEFCKDSVRRDNVGYKSAGDCTAAVIDGDFSIVTNVPARRTSSPASSSSTSTSSSATVTTISRQSASKNKVEKVEKVSEKVEDLSDLSPASKKRRSLAACKKSSTRKFANMGSESKCTESVLSGNYDALIEALEYGK